MRISDWSSDVCSSDLHDQFSLEPMPQRGKLPLCGRSQLHRRTRRAGDDQMVWLFDLDNTLHDSSRAIFKAIDRSMTTRSEERRVGKECVSTCRSRWAPYT